MDALATSPVLSVKYNAQVAAGASIDGATGSRWNNAVSYKSANFSGFSAHVVYSMGEVTNELAQGENYGIGADYAAGPFAVKYVYQHATNNAGGTLSMGAPTGGTPGTLTGVQDEHYVGASWDLKVVKLMGSAQVLDKGGRVNAVAGQAAEGAVYTMGAVVPVGKGNIHASYAYADLNSNQANGQAYNGDYNGVALAYTHGLSKRTTAYTGVRYQDRDSKGTNNTNSGAGAVTTVFAAGINHTF
jgi:predicted porin